MKNKINTIPAVLSSIAKKFSSKAAMILNNGNSITFDDMMWDVSNTVRVLKELGISKNSKVALFMDNSPQCVESFLAITKMGAVAVLLSYSFSDEQLFNIISSEKPEAVFVSESKTEIFKSVKNTTVLAMDDNRVLNSVAHQVKNSISEVKEKDSAVVMYSLEMNGTFERQVMTQSAFISMSNASKKAKKSNSAASPLEALRNFIAPILNGFAVTAAV